MATTHRPEILIFEVNNPAFALDPEDKLIVDRAIVLSSLAGAGIDAAGDNEITLSGTASGLYGVRTNAAVIEVTANGLAAGAFGIVGNQDALELTNRGAISGISQGVAIYGSGTVTNHGLIIGGIDSEFDCGIFLADSHTGARIVNKGTIEARSDALCSILSYPENSAADIVVNKGKLIGSVFLGGGDDSFDSSKGRIMGWVNGDAGEDTLKGSRRGDTLIGGTDDDMLTGGKGSDMFEFKPADGEDIITDFDALGGGNKQDYLSLLAGMDYTERSARGGKDTVLDFGEGHTITLRDVNRADFSNADIEFVT
jgi:Ca2+-binding RTX toxin-like protein